jgi:hypothetical protein
VVSQNEIQELYYFIIFYFVIPPSFSPTVMVIMYHLVPRPKLFEITPMLFLYLNISSVFFGVETKRVIFFSQSIIVKLIKSKII